MGVSKRVRPKAQGNAKRNGGKKKTRARGAKSVGGQKKRKTAKKPGRQKVQKGTGTQEMAKWLRSGRREEGCEALVVVRERAGRVLEQVFDTCAVDTGITGSKATGGGRTTVRTRKRGHVSVNVCRALAAVGHVERGRIMAKLLEGPATYRTLQRITKLKAGPLYHHINQLRLAGLMLPKQRDLYELTRGGRNLILTVMAMGGLVRDTKRRPISAE